MPSESLAGSGRTEAAWQHGSSPAEEELMEKLRAECSVEGGQEVKNWKVSLLRPLTRWGTLGSASGVGGSRGPQEGSSVVQEEGVLRRCQCPLLFGYHHRCHLNEDEKCK